MVAIRKETKVWKFGNRRIVPVPDGWMYPEKVIFYATNVAILIPKEMAEADFPTEVLAELGDLCLQIEGDLTKRWKKQGA